MTPGSAASPGDKPDLLHVSRCLPPPHIYDHAETIGSRGGGSASDPLGLVPMPVSSVPVVPLTLWIG